MTLLQEIQVAAVDSTSNLLDLLRKCRVLATRLRNEAFKAWVDRELDGYAVADELPSYRRVQVQSLGIFRGGAGIAHNVSIPPASLPKGNRQIATEVSLRVPIGSLVDAVQEKNDDTLQMPWPADFLAHVRHSIFEDMECVAAWRPIPQTAVVAILDTVRNRVLRFVLEIESEWPEAGEPGGKPIPAEAVTQVVTNVFGNVMNLATASHGFTQVAHMDVRPGDFESLKRYLVGVGVPSSELGELQRALAADDKASSRRTRGGIGRRTAMWIGKLGPEALAGSAVKAISSYLGLH